MKKFSEQLLKKRKELYDTKKEEFRKKYFGESNSFNRPNFNPKKKFSHKNHKSVLIGGGSSRYSFSWQSSIQFWDIHSGGNVFNQFIESGELTPTIKSLFRISKSLFGFVSIKLYAFDSSASSSLVYIDVQKLKGKTKIDYIHGGRCNHAKFNEKHQRVFTGGNDGLVKMWKVKTKSGGSSFESNKTIITSLCTYDDTVVFGSYDVMKFYDIETKKAVRSIEIKDKKFVKCISKMVNKKLIVTADPEKMKIINLENNKVICEKSGDDYGDVIEGFNENQFLFGNSFGKVSLFDLRKQEVIFSIPPIEDYKTVREFAVIDDKSFVVSQVDNFFYDSVNGKCLDVFLPMQCTDTILYFPLVDKKVDGVSRKDHTSDIEVIC